MSKDIGVVYKDYLKDHYLKIYLEDAISQMLIHHHESNISPTTKPMKFFKEYFGSVRQGTHVLLREFTFISATPYNRLCVLKALMQIYRSFFYQLYRFNAREYRTIMNLVFPDFPMQVVQDAISAYDDTKKDKENRIKFIDFIKALKATFCAGELDYEASLIHNQLEDRIHEYSHMTTKDIMNYRKLTATDFLNIDDDKFGSLYGKILDGSELKNILNLNESTASSNDEPVCCRKKTSKSVKKVKEKNGVKEKAIGILAGQHSYNSHNALQCEKGNDAKKDKHRSNSAILSQRTQNRPWR